MYFSSIEAIFHHWLCNMVLPFNHHLIIHDVILAKNSNQRKKIEVWRTYDENERGNNDNTKIYRTHTTNALIIRIPRVNKWICGQNYYHGWVKCVRLVQTHSTDTYVKSLCSTTTLLRTLSLDQIHHKRITKKKRDNQRKQRKNLVMWVCDPATSTNHVRSGRSRGKKSHKTHKNG